MHELPASIDIRPLRTLVQTVEALVAVRDSTHGLVLSELGSDLDGLEGGGGTKGLGTLLGHRNWKASDSDTFVWRRADAQIRQWDQQGEDGLVIWEGTVVEKPESVAPAGLCAVRSSKAVGLRHIKKGEYHPPGAPLCVPGMHGSGLVVAGRHASLGPARLLAMQWWTARGALASHAKDANCKLLRQTTQWWGRSVVHLCAGGYASSAWLGALRGFDARFILRPKLHDDLLTEAGVKQAAWKNPRGKVGLAPRTLWDAVHHGNVQGRVLFFPLPPPDFAQWPLRLVGARRKGATPWYLLSNEPGESAEDAWQVVLADAGRWRIEVLFGTLKSELALQRVRVDGWQDRLKLLGLVRLASALLMDLLGKHHKQARDWLMASACQRTGTHLRQVEQPFSRLRVALSTLWLASACWLVRRGRLIL